MKLKRSFWRFNWVTETYEGEPIENKVRRIEESEEPITDGAPIVYTERSEGVRPEFNIRTDKWDIAESAMNLAHKADAAKGNKVPITSVDGEGEGGGSAASASSNESKKD